MSNLLSTQCGKTKNLLSPKIYSHPKFFSSNQLFSNFVDKIVAFTKFLPKMSDEVEKREIHCYAIFFRQINLQFDSLDEI